ncbi:MAG TPA: hypothetical protein VNZ45_03210 [Bacteroidia bacterium]|jgi:hypothetical protein|nr:hypothetical protein [Bacteroidia bacterium]
MDVTALNVSIEVDMSGFIEAMEELVALIKTVADELMKVEQHAGNITINNLPLRQMPLIIYRQAYWQIILY